MSVPKVDRGTALIRLADPHITPVSNLTGFVLSAFTGKGELDLEYVNKYKAAYSAFLNKDNAMTVVSRIKRADSKSCPVSKVDELRTALVGASFTPADDDLAKLIETMVFKVEPTVELEEDNFGETDEILDEAVEDMRVSAVSAAVINAYKELYQSVFSPLPPKGVYAAIADGYPNGVIKHNTAHNKDNMKGGLPGYDSYVSPTSHAVLVIRMIYRMLGLEALVETGQVDAKELGATGKAYYFTRQHGRLASGVISNNSPRFKSWDEFERNVTAWVNSKLSSVYKEYNKVDAGADFDAQLAQSRAVEAALRAAGNSLATSVVVEVCDPKVANLLVLRVCAPTVLSGEIDKEKIAEAISGGWNAMALRDITYVRKDPAMDFCVYTITVALNSKLERSAPMYAFQVWEQLEATGDVRELIGTHNIIFGRKSDGSMKAYNMKVLTADPHNTSVIAASQSGKGLTTLSAVAAAAVHGQPIFYLDGKPDMAAAFWRYMEAHSNPAMRGRVFAFDGLEYSATPLGAGSDPETYRHMLPPVELPDLTPMQIGGLITAKTLSLMLAIMKTTSSGAAVSGVGDVLGYDFTKGGLFVFDEVQKLDEQSWTALAELISSWSATMMKGVDGAAVYRKTLYNYINSVRGEINQYSNALSKKTHIGMFTLFQDIAYVSGNSTFKGMFGTNTFIGRIKGSKLGYVNNAVTEEMQAAFDKYQWYNPEGSATAILAKLKAQEELKGPIKPFLLFNDEENIAGYCKGVYSSLDPSIKRMIDEERTRGDKNRLHIAGLLNYYGVDLAGPLSLGYDIAQNFLRLVGFKGSVSDYILSTHIDTLIDYTTLCAKAFAAVKKNPSLRLPTPGTPECLYSISEGRGSRAVDINDGDMAADFQVPDYDTPQEPKSEQNTPVQDTVVSTPKVRTAGIPAGGVSFVPRKGVEVKDDKPFMNYTETEPTTFTTETAPETPESFVSYGEPQSESFIESHGEPFGEGQAVGAESAGVQQEQPQQPLYYINGMAFVLGPDGNFHFHSGRLAPLHGVAPGTFQGVPRATAPTIDQNTGRLPYDETPTGERVLNDPNAMMYGQFIDGPEGKLKRKPKAIDVEKMPSAKFERAISERWAMLLSLVSKFVGGASLVATLGIAENAVYVNGIQFYPPDGLLNDAGLRVVDIVDFNVLFKQFKQLKQLMLDYKAYTVFTAQYGGVHVPFTKHKNLLSITYIDSSGKKFTYTREHAAYEYDVPLDKLHYNFNTWTAMMAQVNKGSTSSFCKPGTRLLMADYTKRLASGVFGTKSNWSTKRKVLGFIGMALTGAATVVTGGIQMARASRRQKEPVTEKEPVTKK